MHRRTFLASVAAPLCAQDRERSLRIAVQPKARTLRKGFVFTEGPVCTKNGDLYFTDVGEERIYRFSNGSVQVIREKSNLAIGLALDRQGRLIVCERGRLTRIEPNAETTILADVYQGKGLNWPNDAVVRSDDSIFFTDLKPKAEQAEASKTGFNAVYRWSRNDGLRIISRECQHQRNRPLSHGGFALRQRHCRAEYQSLRVTLHRCWVRSNLYTNVVIRWAGWH